MSRSALSVFVFGIYLVLLGPSLLVIPNGILAVFGMPAVSDVWIRVVGMLVLLIGVYYLQAARCELRPIFRVSVVARSSVLVFFVAFVLLELAPPALILFGLIDAAGAAWTAISLRKDAASA